MRDGPLNLTGRTFGKLKAMSALKNRGPNGEVRWVFRCLCGRKVNREAKFVIDDARKGKEPCCSKCEKENAKELEQAC